VIDRKNAAGRMRETKMPRRGDQRPSYFPPRAIPHIALRAQGAAAALDISVSTFLAWVREGKMPSATKIGGIALYDVRELQRSWDHLRGGATKSLENPFDD
jgi:hypothetical protein